MDQLLEALARLVDDWGWLLVVMFFMGGGDALGRILSGRRANATLRAKLKVTKEENDHLRELMKNTTHALSPGPGAPQDPDGVAALAEQTRKALEDRAVLLGLLIEVRASDRAWPQLPEELLKDIDYALDTMRPALRPDKKEKEGR